MFFFNKKIENKDNGQIVYILLGIHLYKKENNFKEDITNTTTTRDKKNTARIISRYKYEISKK